MRPAPPSRVEHTPVAQPWWRPWRAVLVAFILAFVLGMVLAASIQSFGHWDHGYQWEVDLMLRVHRPLPAWLDAIVFVTPWVGTNLTLAPLVVGLAVWLWRRCQRPDLSAQLLTVQLGSYLLNPSLKALYARDRPHLFERRGWYAMSSYPSGHAIASISVLIAIGIVLYRARGWRWPLLVLAPIAVISIYSRLYLGVHWPTDVLAGTAVGLVWLLLSIYAFRDRRNGSIEHASEVSVADG